MSFLFVSYVNLKLTVVATSGEVLASNLQELIQLKQITQIRIYMIDSDKLRNGSCIWSFTREFIELN